MKKFLPLLSLGVLFFTACGKNNKYPVVSTFAGSGAMGSVNGNGTAASFSNMMGIATDDRGNVYVADSHNNLIRKISADGLVTTLAGNGLAGSADGRGDTASFFNPAAVAVDKNGNVYVADTHNNLIRKINPDGFVTTFAGQRVYHSIPGTDTTIRFDNPDGIAVDTGGNVYVADWANDRIRKISPDGFVTTVAGRTGIGSANGKAAAASFSHPVGIAVDREGNIYVADVGNNKIRKITPDALVTTFAGSGARGSRDGRDTIAAFNRPYGITIDKWGNFFVADYQNNLIRKIVF